jgi:hypothetical protein
MNTYAGASRALLRWLYDEGHMPALIADQVHLAEPERRIDQAGLDAATIAAIEGAGWGWSRDPPRGRALTLVLLHAGLEVQEVVGLAWSDVDLAARRLTVRPPRGPTRTIPLTARLHEALNTLHRRGQGTGPVFTNPQDGAMSVRGVNLLIAELADYVGEPKLSPRALRTAFMRRKVAGGASLKTVAQLAGLSSVNALRTRLGILGSEIQPCPECDGHPNPGPLSARCAACFGTGSSVSPPAAYVAGLDLVTARTRIKAWSTELRRLADALRAHGMADDAVDARLEGVGLVLWGIAGTMQPGGYREPPTGEHAGGPVSMVALTQRLRALGTDLRRLGRALVSVGWAPPEMGSWLERNGANVSLLAFALEEGHREVEMWPKPGEGLGHSPA